MQKKFAVGHPDCKCPSPSRSERNRNLKLFVSLLTAIATGFAAAAPASADNHASGNGTTASAPGIPGLDGWIGLGAGAFFSTIRHATAGEVRTSGMGAQIEVGLRRDLPKAPNVGVWFSLARLTIDYGEVTVRDRTFNIDANGKASLLSVGFDGIRGLETLWRPYSGVFVGTDGNVGLLVGIRYRFENNFELGCRIMAGRENMDIPRFSDMAWAALSVTTGYAF